jgi:hypothetical protein
MNSEHLKAIINKELHTLEQNGSYAAISIGNPGRVHRTDYSVFKKSIDEQGKLYTLKKQCDRTKKLTLIGRYEF